MNSGNGSYRWIKAIVVIIDNQPIMSRIAENLIKKRLGKTANSE